MKLTQRQVDIKILYAVIVMALVGYVCGGILTMCYLNLGHNLQAYVQFVICGMLFICSIYLMIKRQALVKEEKLLKSQ